ncbi:MAG TPA: hypothetical protein DEU95_01015 [Chloroflexi bacterium]|nr:hypothetical protein [Chloroflexota bacterium]HBY46130.1 hypothetical protein [Chloroflexota bacterium]HCG28348.1 hypothetical protein [Chloroflexota bacterium]
MAQRTAAFIREFQPSDIPALNALHNDPDVAANLLQVPFTTDAERAEWIRQSPTQRTLVVELDGEPAGLLGLTPYTRRRDVEAAIRRHPQVSDV